MCLFTVAYVKNGLFDVMTNAVTKRQKAGFKILGTVFYVGSTYINT